MITVTDMPNCTWVLDGGSFFCSHDEVEVADTTYCYLESSGPLEVKSSSYVCAECGEPLDGDPEADSHQMLVELGMEENED